MHYKKFAKRLDIPITKNMIGAGTEMDKIEHRGCFQYESECLIHKNLVNL